MRGEDWESRLPHLFFYLPLNKSLVGFLLYTDFTSILSALVQHLHSVDLLSLWTLN